MKIEKLIILIIITSMFISMSGSSSNSASLDSADNNESSSISSGCLDKSLQNTWRSWRGTSSDLHIACLKKITLLQFKGDKGDVASLRAAFEFDLSLSDENYRIERLSSLKILKELCLIEIITDYDESGH